MLPLCALLSQSWVSFAIELDNEFEHRMPHRTTRHGSTASRQAPWLGSMTLWFTCMKYLTDGPVSVRELERLARTKTNLHGMQRWGYVRIDDGVIEPTRAGRDAQNAWAPLFGEVEQTWSRRFGQSNVGELRKSLQHFVERLELQLPDSMPILGYGLFSDNCSCADGRETGIEELPIPALLAKPLLAFTLEFESVSKLSLAISANVLRLVGAEGVRSRDLPQSAYVSKEAIAMALGYLQRHGFATVKTAQDSPREKIVTLTSKGRTAREHYLQSVDTIENAWRGRFGSEAVDALRGMLEPIAAAQRPKPYPDGWRASADRNTGLPHHPMVLHRGGYPDGA